MAKDSVPKDSSVIQYEKAPDQASVRTFFIEQCSTELSQKVGVCPLQTPPKEDINWDKLYTAKRFSKTDRVKIGAAKKTLPLSGIGELFRLLVVQVKRKKTKKEPWCCRKVPRLWGRQLWSLCCFR